METCIFLFPSLNKKLRDLGAWRAKSFTGCVSTHLPLDKMATILADYNHYSDVIMGTIASQITSLTNVYSTVYSDADQRKHQSSASLAFVRGIHRRPVNSPHKWPVTRKNVSIWWRHRVQMHFLEWKWFHSNLFSEVQLTIGQQWFRHRRPSQNRQPIGWHCNRACIGWIIY